MSLRVRYHSSPILFPSPKPVITSYSIHYTKLYDTEPRIIPEEPIKKAISFYDLTGEKILDLKNTVGIAQESGLPVILSGGISCDEDFRSVTLDAADSGIAGIISYNFV